MAAPAAAPALVDWALEYERDGELADHVKCPVCHDVLRDAVKIGSCGDLACRRCVEKLPRRVCPACQVAFEPGDVKPLSLPADKVVLGQINAVRIRCKHAKRGCAWAGPLGDALAHLEKHCAREWCANRAHGCDLRFPNSAAEMARHGDECKFAPVACAFAQGGCEVMGPRGDMAKHEQACGVGLRQRRAEKERKLAQRAAEDREREAARKAAREREAAETKKAAQRVAEGLVVSSEEAARRIYVRVRGNLSEVLRETLTESRAKGSPLAAAVAAMSKNPKAELFLDVPQEAWDAALSWLTISLLPVSLSIHEFVELRGHLKRMGLPELGLQIATTSSLRMPLPALTQGLDLSGCVLRECKWADVDLTDCDLRRADLTGSSLMRCNLSKCRLAGAVLRNCDLSSCTLEDGDLEEAVLDGARLPARVVRCNLRAASCVGVVCEKGELVECELSHGKWRKARLSGSNLMQCTAFGVDAEDAGLSKCALPSVDMSIWKVRGASLSGCDLREVELPQKLERVSLEGADVSGKSFAGMEVRGCSFKGASMAGADFGGSLLEECSGLDFAKALNVVGFLARNDSRGADLSGQDLSGLDLRGRDLSGAVLLGAKLPRNLKGAKLVGCDMSGADLFNADLSDALVDRARFAGANLAGAKRDGVRGSPVDMIMSHLLSGEQFLQLNKFIVEGRALEGYTLLFRGSRDGFRASDFHRLCDGKANTLVVVRTTEGRVFGG